MLVARAQNTTFNYGNANLGKNISFHDQSTNVVFTIGLLVLPCLALPSLLRPFALACQRSKGLAIKLIDWA